VRVLSLLSGGKDSVAATYVAKSHGFEVVGACSLVVTGEDSHMFHRPNSRWAPLVAQAMGLRSFTRETQGEAEKELDDLAALLEDAKKQTDADGVVVGALGSEYQRTRVERIGHALDLKTFTPIWHKDPLEYMKWLIQARFHVRFVAVSAEGLGMGWLGRLLTPRAFEALCNQSQRFRFHLAGEGGEYETLVTNGPFFQRPLIVDEARTSWHRDHGTWDIQQAHLGESQERVPPLPEE
jgi:diphthine-ammonia ligase